MPIRPAACVSRGAAASSAAMDAAVTAIADKVRRVLEPRAEILEAYLFGSTARGEARGHSDVDVAVYVDERRLPPTAFGYDAELATECSRALGGTCADLVLLNHAGPMLYHRVLRDGIRLLSRNLVQTTVREGRALSRYCDWVPQLAKLDAAASARIRRGDFGK